MLKTINESWGWVGFTATNLIDSNDFGNVLFLSESGDYWRICPEELSCEIVAKNSADFDKLLQDADFQIDWFMENAVREAISKLGQLMENEKFYLIVPGVIGGTYAFRNYGKLPFEQLIRLSGDLAYQIKDVSDGTRIKLKIVRGE